MAGSLGGSYPPIFLEMKITLQQRFRIILLKLYKIA